MKVKYIPAKRCARIKFNESDEAKLRTVLNKTTRSEEHTSELQSR